MSCLPFIKWFSNFVCTAESKHSPECSRGATRLFGANSNPKATIWRES